VLEAAQAVVVNDPHEGRCRICGKIDSLTREHLPPVSAQIDGRIIVHTLEEWLARSSEDAVPGGMAQQGGVWTRALCASCNSTTGSWYGNEYRGWVARAMAVMRQLPPLEELDAHDRMEQVEVRVADVDPGAFVRQVLSLLCTVSGPWDLAGRHPEIRAMILDRQSGTLPAGMRLHLVLYCGSGSRIAGPSLVIDRGSRRWEWLLELAYPPLAMLLVLAGNAEPRTLLDISEFTTVSPGQVFNYQAILDIGFGHTALPGDYRPSGALGDRAGANPPHQ
jgi:hypothetical protein